eukprot:m.765764 g.765764  ORF g.765764 m.765764 type:complete len:122 (-) comp23223_c0_seq3:1271-1636(-)
MIGGMHLAITPPFCVGSIAARTLFVASDGWGEARDVDFSYIVRTLRDTHGISVFKYPEGKMLTGTQIRRQSSIEVAQQSVIDQIICGMARHFLGTDESTFTQRIREDRDFAGHPMESSYEM